MATRPKTVPATKATKKAAALPRVRFLEATVHTVLVEVDADGNLGKRHFGEPMRLDTLEQVALYAAELPAAIKQFESDLANTTDSK